MMATSVRTGSPAGAFAETLQSRVVRLIDGHLHEDRWSPDLFGLLSSSATLPSVSGMSDMDYPLQELPGGPNLPELSAVRRVPLPPELEERFRDVQCNCMMGVFPEIRRAWVTIDNVIYMWDYENGSDLAYFDGRAETILSVGLVKPRPETFHHQLVDHVHYLLVLATPVDVVVLELLFLEDHTGLNDGMPGEVQLMPKPLFSIPTDNTYILAIASTNRGRIFLAGKDGGLYELIIHLNWFSQLRCRKVKHLKKWYDAASFLVPHILQPLLSLWSADPIVQIAIDNSRNTLFTRSESGVLQVFDLGDDGMGLSWVKGEMSQSDIVSAARNISSAVDRSVFSPIVHISVIDRYESSHCHLLAITHAGVRLYFSTDEQRPCARPSCLRLVHIRLPPGFPFDPAKPVKVHKALHSKGVLVMVFSETEYRDVLWCINRDFFPFRKPLMETHMISNMDGHTRALCAINEERPAKVLTPPNRDLIPITDPPVVVEQHNISRQRFILLSPKGSVIFRKLLPVDQLRHLLVRCAGGEGEEIERFFKLQGEEQACATALILACSKAACDTEVSVWSTKAIFRYGGEAQLRIPSGTASTTPMHSGAAPIPQLSDFPVVFSGMHNGISIYFARILGSIWDGSLAVERNRWNQTILESSVSPYYLETVLLKLKGLQEFLDNNFQFVLPSEGAASFSSLANLQQRPLDSIQPDEGSPQQVQQGRRFHMELQAYEKMSLQGIQQLVHRSCQTLALWKLLCDDNKFSLITSVLSAELQDQMKLRTFRYLVTQGKELVEALITALIDVNIKDGVSVDAVSKHLMDVCPLLCNSDDAVYYKANELLQWSRQIQNKAEKERTLRKSLQLYQQISHHVRLPLVCSHFRQVQFYEGVLELCLAAADRKDPQGLACHFYKNGEPEEDRAGQIAFQERFSCYKCITDTLQELVDQSKADFRSLTVSQQPVTPGMTSHYNMSFASNETATSCFEQMLGLAQRSRDELFHVALYNWLIEADLTDTLLQVNGPYLEEHLRHMIKQDHGMVRNVELLWRYYEKNLHFAKASRVLARLADMSSTEIPLKQRLQYIARAIVLAQGADGEYLHELEEKMEVARIQVQIQDALSKYPPDPSVNNAIALLDSELMDLTKLYEEFADHFKMPECKLAILHCAGHAEDPALIHSLWREIIEKALADSVSKCPADRMRALSFKLVPLGKIYTGKYFPHEFLVKFLEQQARHLNWDAAFVQRTMQEIGVRSPHDLDSCEKRKQGPISGTHSAW